MKKIFSLPMLVGLAAVLLSLAQSVRPARADHAAPGRGAILDMDADTHAQARPDVAWNEACDKFLVVYDRKRTDVDYNIFGRYVNGDGLALGAGPFQITVNDLKQQNPAVAYNPFGSNNFVVVWQDYRNDHWEIWVQLVGCRKDMIGDPIRITTDENITHYQLNPDVACGYGDGHSDMSGCWVVWEDFRNGNWDIYAQKLTAAGALDGENIQLTSSTAWQRNPAIAYNRENTGCADLGSFMVVWDDTRNSAKGYGTDIYAQQLDWGNLCGVNLPVYTGSGEQRRPDIAYGTTNNHYQVVWEDSRNGNWDIYARMTTPNGGTIGASFALAINASSSQSRPAVAYDAEFANEFTTVWNDNRNGNLDIFGQRTSGAGALIGPNSSVVATSASESSPSIAFGNTSHHYFVIWVDSGAGIKGRAVWR